MNPNLNEKCLLNYLCGLQDNPSKINEQKNNLVNLLKDFGVKIKITNDKNSNPVYGIIESYGEMSEWNENEIFNSRANKPKSKKDYGEMSEWNENEIFNSLMN